MKQRHLGDGQFKSQDCLYSAFLEHLFIPLTYHSSIWPNKQEGQEDGNLTMNHNLNNDDRVIKLGTI